jgi:AcrR family transcriptional regulator
MRESRENAILRCSEGLFMENGYDDTTMREIAEAANVSLGLASYHFKSKRHIALKIMDTYLRFLKAKLCAAVSQKKEPLLHSASMIRLCIKFFMMVPRRNFYLECLARDIYMESIQNLGNDAISNIVSHQGIDASPDVMLLFDNYIPPSVEKIIILEKDKGNFKGISDDEIPDIVFEVSVGRFISKRQIEDTVSRAREVTERLIFEAYAETERGLFAVSARRR